MRILHVSKYAHTGGVETFVRDLSTEQARQGHDVAVLCHRETPLRPTETRRENGVEFIRCAILCRTAFAPVAPMFARRLKDETKRFRPDVIHLHLPNPAVLFHTSFPEDIPLVVHWHADVDGSTNPLVRTLYPLYRAFEQACLARTDSVIATSPPYLESSPSLTRWRDKCSVVPLGLDLDRYPEGDEEKPLRPLVLAVGRFTFYKGFEQLVRAAALVEEADFAIVGDGPQWARIEGEVGQLGLADRVTLAGHVSHAELCRHLQRASLFCLPSVDRGEAFGVTLLEAMRYGLPLISTSIPGSGTGWVNRDGVTGCVVPPADPEALARAIREIIGDREKSERLGRAARTRLENKFRIAEVAEAIRAIYDKAVSD